MSRFDAVEQLALGVVKPGGNALFLNEDNTPVDYWVPVGQAAQSGMPFLVELKEDLAAFDLDSDELVACGEALEEWALSEGWPVVVVTSGRAGHRHLYVRCEDRALIERRALAVGIPATARRRSIRPPLAPHRFGLPTALVRPETVEEALEALGPAAQNEATQKNLPEWLLTLISGGDTQGRYATRSAMALAIASGLRGAGYDFHTYRTVMANRDNAGGAKYHTLEDGEGREKPDAFLARTWEKAANRLSPEEIVAELESARAAVMATDWTGDIFKTCGWGHFRRPPLRLIRVRWA